MSEKRKAGGQTWPMEAFSGIDRTPPKIDWVKIEKNFESLKPKHLILLELIAQGLSNTEIAKRMTYTVDSVGPLVNSLFEVLGIHEIQGNSRSIATQIWHKMKARPIENPFDDSHQG